MMSQAVDYVTILKFDKLWANKLKMRKHVFISPITFEMNAMYVLTILKTVLLQYTPQTF